MSSQSTSACYNTLRLWTSRTNFWLDEQQYDTWHPPRGIASRKLGLLTVFLKRPRRHAGAVEGP